MSDQSAPEGARVFDAVRKLADDLWIESQQDHMVIRDAGIVQGIVYRLRGALGLSEDPGEDVADRRQSSRLGATMTDLRCASCLAETHEYRPGRWSKATDAITIFAGIALCLDHFRERTPLSTARGRTTCPTCAGVGIIREPHTSTCATCKGSGRRPGMEDPGLNSGLGSAEADVRGGVDRG